MSKSMDFKELSELINHIRNHHKFGSKEPHGRMIKYFRPSFDFRTDDVFYVELNSYGLTKEFLIINEYREIKESLFDRIMRWLDGEDVI